MASTPKALAHLFLGNNTKVGDWETVGCAKPQRAGVIWRYLEIISCRDFHVLWLLSSPLQGLEGILDESDDEDEAENITEVDATRSCADHLLSINSSVRR